GLPEAGRSSPMPMCLEGEYTDSGDGETRRAWARGEPWAESNRRRGRCVARTDQPRAAGGADTIAGVLNGGARGYCSRLDAVSQVGFVQRLQSLPTNIFAACVSPLSCHRSQLEATFANSPPPG